MKRILLALSLASLSLGGTSCIGPNNAFNSVYAWNSRAAESKWVNELIHLGLYVVPVYPLALAGDLLVFNSIEFWGGNNPIEDPEPFKPVNDATDL